jgi:hypothetical protein
LHKLINHRPRALASAPRAGPTLDGKMVTLVTCAV